MRLITTITVLAAFVLACAISAGASAQTARTAAWSDTEIEALAYALSEAWTHGLDPDDYPDPETLRSLPWGVERSRLAQSVWFDYAEDLAFGMVDPRALDEDWTAPVRDQDLITLYAQAREGQGIYESLQALAPSHPDYLALRAELVRRTTLPETPIQVPYGDEVLAMGDRGDRVDALRARLGQLGLYSGSLTPGAEFDQQLQSALMRFQTRHNLAADGEAGRSTLREMNAGESRRIDQIRANLERWRWLPADLGDRHIRVNIADYKLEAWEGGAPARTHEVMIGQRYSRTPVFSEEMSIIEINPYWLTPGGLGARWVRTFRTNPGYALSQGYRLVDLDTGRRVNPYEADWGNRRYRVIQVPGDNNAMGRVKFLFPNRHNVYIHDTPSRHLFANSQRDDSSGCVRVQYPEELAIWLLEAEGWDPQAVMDVFDSGDTRRVRLRDTVPVHILYFTAVSDTLGRIGFVHDVYERDDRLIAALEDPPIYIPPAEREPEETDAEDADTEAEADAEVDENAQPVRVPDEVQ